MHRGAPQLLVLTAVIMLWRCVSFAQDCIGDCDGDRVVRVNELILGVNIALDQRPVSACPALANAEGRVDIAQLTSAVLHALDGCGPVPMTTPTGTATATPTPTGSPLSPHAACAALNDRTIGGAVIQSATLIATSGVYPEYCKVLGTIAPHLNFEVRLPTRWSGRALYVGGGGLDGYIPSPQGLLFNPDIADVGYVTIGSDSGHQGSFGDGSWALDDPQAVENLAYLATHSVLGAAQAITAARYGRPADRTYWFGSSQGGREGLIAAQRWPNDFDGIAALEPVYDLTALTLAMNRVAQQVFATPNGRLSSGQIDTLAQAVLDACDGLDGLADGIISNVGACRFDPSTLHCTGTESDPDQCLGDAQIDTVNVVHGELTLDFPLAHDIRSYPGWPTGHEYASPGTLSGWQYWVTGASSDPSTSVGFSLSDQILRFLIAHDAQLDTLHFSPAAHAAELTAFSQLIDATDPDLTAFAAHGGKLILWHGLADYAVSARSTMRYYDRVVAALGREAADRFIRFYTSPGVGHLNDGPGAGTADFLGALIAWVETGAAPGDLIAVKTNPRAGRPPLFTRPLCRYPTYPRYAGTGDPNDASSFTCAEPTS